MEKPELLLIGGGGHCKSCIDVIEQNGKYRVAGIVDVTENLHKKICGYENIATDADLPKLAREYENFLISLGQITNPHKRIKLYHTLKGLNLKLPVITSPIAYVSKYAEIQEGTIIMHHALVNAGARVGRNCIINSKSLIEHDAIIGNHCHIATGAKINGGVTIGSGTFIGSNAVCIQNIEIGENLVIGCGKTIVKNISPNALAKANP
mgnify:CR=1 FL=1|jgi:sugar O-acyltransferase (sialic acid O-acetyltransferase NeuD family)